MQAGTSVQRTQEIGGLLDDFSLADLEGRQQTLSELMAGRKGAVVVFWSGVCSHCVRYDGYLNEFSQRHPELAFVAIASRHGETPVAIRKTAAERQLKFPILHDDGGATADRWFTQQTPRAFLIDSDRRLLYRGAIDNFKYAADPAYVAYLEPAIAEFLAGRAVSLAETASFGCAIKSVYYILPKKL